MIATKKQNPRTLEPPKLINLDIHRYSRTPVYGFFVVVYVCVATEAVSNGMVESDDI